MNRNFCRAHTHRGSSRAWRLIAARHCLDGDLHRHIVAEHQDCVDCLADTVEALSDAYHGLLIRCGPLPSMDDHGVVTGPVVDMLLERIDDALEAEGLDRRELGRG